MKRSDAERQLAEWIGEDPAVRKVAQLTAEALADLRAQIADAVARQDAWLDALGAKVDALEEGATPPPVERRSR